MSTIGTESRLGFVTVHHLPVVLKLLIQQPICTTEEEEYLSLRIYKQSESKMLKIQFYLDVLPENGLLFYNVIALELHFLQQLKLNASQVPVILSMQKRSLEHNTLNNSAAKPFKHMPQQRICLRLASRLSPVLCCCSQNEVVYISTPIFMTYNQQLQQNSDNQNDPTKFL